MQLDPDLNQNRILSWNPLKLRRICPVRLIRQLCIEMLNKNNERLLCAYLVNCWPSENDGQCDVNIEYELQQEEMELKDVTITIPVP